MWIYASRVAFRSLVALVPLTLLGLALLSAFGLEEVWRDSVAPAIEAQLVGVELDELRRKNSRQA